MRGQHADHIESTLDEVTKLLAADEQLPSSFRDHKMKGSLKRYRNCHLRPNLVLWYAKIESDTLQLVALGSHAELGI